MCDKITFSEANGKPLGGGYGKLHAEAKAGWRRETSKSRDLANRPASNARRGLPCRDQTGTPASGITALRRWQRSHKGLEPASVAILGYLIEVATQGVATCRQTTIAVRAGLSVATVKRRLALLEHLGLISRTKRYGVNGHRKCDAVTIEVAQGSVTLLPDQMKALVKRFHHPSDPANSGQDFGPSGEDERPRLKCPGVAQETPKGSYFPPYPVSSVSPQSQGGAPAERRCDAPATPSITDAGDPGFQIEDGRPKDGQGSAPADVPAPAEAPDPAADDALDRPSPLYDEPLREADDGSEFREDDRLSAGYARDTRARVTTTGSGTHDRARPSRRAHRRTSENRSSEPKSLIWRESLPKMIALRGMLGHAISDRTARKRIGQLVKVYGPEVTSSALVATIDAGPGGCPFEYATKTAEGLTIDRTVEQNIFRAPIDFY